MQEWKIKETKETKKRRIAWVFTVCLIAFSIVFGSYRHFNNMRADGANILSDTVLPSINVRLEHAFNMTTIARRNFESPITNTLANQIRAIEDSDDPAVILALHRPLTEYVLQLQSAAANAGMIENDVSFMRSAYLNFSEHDMIIRQSGYNTRANNFNDELSRNLGWLVRWLVAPLPTYN